MQWSRVLGFGSLVMLGAVIAACGGNDRPAPGESEMSQQAQRTTSIQSGATPPPEGSDPLEAAVVKTLIALQAKDRDALSALSANALTDADFDSAFLCTRGASGATVTSQTPTVTGTTASVALELKMNVGMSIKRPKPVWEYTQVGDEWKLSAVPTCVQG